MYEQRKQPLASKQTYYRRVARNLTIASTVMAICLLIGTIGFHTACGGSSIRWLDAFHNSAMLLSGMGPVITNLCDGGIWFSSFYALFGGVIFITNIGIILAPAIHRLFHKFHLEER